MIISVSRRTDIPGNYSEWFMNRVKESYVLTRNPMNKKQISSVSLKPEDVTCLVFWTRNPSHMIKYLDELKEYNYYFQVTLTSYQKDFEVNGLSKKDAIEGIKELSDRIGADKVIWRYDPIIINDKYDKDYHLHNYKEICEALNGYVKTCVVSFVEPYKKIRKILKSNNVIEMSEINKREILTSMVSIATENSIVIKSCASEIDFSDVDVQPSRCIDNELIKKLFNIKVKDKDLNQRENCGCVSSVDIGSYDTCINGCIYCYANINKETAKNNFINQKNDAKLLGKQLAGDEKITLRKIKRVSQQIDLFGNL